MFRCILLLFTVSLLLGSCSSSKETEKLIVASKQGDCIGVAPMKCLLIKRDGQVGWEFFYNGIEGFKYEPGYEYVLTVEKRTVENPAADQSALRYILVKEESRTQKISENMPDSILEDDIIVVDSI